MSVNADFRCGPTKMNGRQLRMRPIQRLPVDYALVCKLGSSDRKCVFMGR